MRKENAWREFLDKHYPYRKMMLFWVFIMLLSVSSSLWLARTLEKWVWLNNGLSPLISLIPFAALFLLGITLEIRVENRLQKEFDEQ
ncbi:hypothetical protein A2303_01685 [Candidatus Falkowbacteria bacterium RIFOXYB2_FULL_47_14]|uniref:Uncharacterized protein n=1 Tax=Candidatus Falkowbacteria bacterium RIFOXYA2_FULL_47_19 TaxID=1797994 RepID=A0A1F5SLJ7_9BACT|nr:MAG: hypothetical protein A2227_01760 [Candidatus Falkowbacteria bacterium RIFOXYA2_FULL_47_19]OGF36842.1 MAG: hypothetical protein A2468_07390 [Candidatus Falkowbacteria bacterium RIFOXYC2_FULL_46_15]OGF43492.1 MAG: hypothetical protein A2303_01685 [Candidatus Falkowbacteria bacterium RIFOXYB2_FULL_47_14]